MNAATERARTEAWLILLRTPGLGPAALRALVDRCGDAVAARDTARRDATLKPDSRAWLQRPDADLLAADLAWLAAPGHHLLGWDSPDYPPLLREIPGAPAALFIDGAPTDLWLPQIAIVGSRSANHAGLATARSFARALADAGFAISSGLADGIDGAAHAAALGAGGRTLAVLGTGPDLIYPGKHRELAARIAAGGALISEFPPGTTARPEFFPRRNRIIAGLSLGILVVEAGIKSGSLITARYALEQGRELFAIPGSIHNPLARGCHELIRNGAKLTETAAQVIEELAPLARGLGEHLRQRLAQEPAAEPTPRVGDFDADCRSLLDALGHEPAAVDELAERTGLSVPELSSLLLRLELDGAITTTRGGGYARSLPA